MNCAITESTLHHQPSKGTLRWIRQPFRQRPPYHLQLAIICASTCHRTMMIKYLIVATLQLHTHTKGDICHLDQTNTLLSCCTIDWFCGFFSLCCHYLFPHHLDWKVPSIFQEIVSVHLQVVWCWGHQGSILCELWKWKTHPYAANFEERIAWTECASNVQFQSVG